MQIVADVLQVPLQRLSGHPGSCLGAAWTAAVGSGLAEDWAGVSGFISLRDRIEPQASNQSVYARGYESFRALYQQLRGTTG